MRDDRLFSVIFSFPRTGFADSRQIDVVRSETLILATMTPSIRAWIQSRVDQAGSGLVRFWPFGEI
jgi:hypothetical protein